MNSFNYFFLIEICKRLPSPAENCSNGYTLFSSVVGCPLNVCNEDLPSRKAQDQINKLNYNFAFRNYLVSLYTTEFK